MPMPLWWGQINKKLFNPGALEKGSWPVLRHVGRSSGQIRRTPRVIPLEDAFAKLPVDTKRPPGLLRISECLVMDAVKDRAGTSNPA